MSDEGPKVPPAAKVRTARGRVILSLTREAAATVLVGIEHSFAIVRTFEADPVKRTLWEAYLKSLSVPLEGGIAELTETDPCWCPNCIAQRMEAARTDRSAGDEEVG